MSNKKSFLTTNIDYLKNLIHQDPETLIELLTQKELSSLLTMDKQNQEMVLKTELEQMTNDFNRDCHQFLINRTEMWRSLILENPDHGIEVITPILQDMVEDTGSNCEEFILKETVH